MTTLARLEAALRAAGSRPGGRGTWQCPAHEDRTPSLSVGEGAHGAVIHCHAGCAPEAIVAALGLAMSDLYDDGAAEGRPRRRTRPDPCVEDLGTPTAAMLAALAPSRRVRDGRTLERMGARLVRAWGVEWLGIPTLADGGWKLWALSADGRPRLDEHGRLVRRNVGVGSLVVSPALRERGPLAAIGRLWDVEGESDLLAGIDAGLSYVVSGTTGTGGATKGHEANAGWLRGLEPAEVAVIGDLDDAGRGGAEKRAAWWLAQGVAVRVVELPDELGEKGDLRDYLNGRPARNGAASVEPFGDAASLGALADVAERREPAPRVTPGPVLVRLSDVEPARAVEWLWRGYVPRGTLTIIEGDPGLGKSALTCDLAARVSTGASMPDGSPGVAGGVVILSAEDSLSDTIRPRLEAAGADLARVVALSAIRDTEGERLPELPLDLGGLERAVAESEAALVVIDPLMAYLGSEVNSWRDQDVRRALAPLAALAERTGCAVVIVRHLNKAAGGSAIYRGGGSIGIVGAARAAFVVAKDPDDESRRVLAPVKCNLAAPPPSRGFCLVESGLGVRVEWLGESAHSADAILAAPAGEEERSALETAMGALREALAEGPRGALEARKDAKGAGVSDRTLDRAKARLPIRARKAGFGGPWLWCLPCERCADWPKSAKDARRAPIPGVASFEDSWRPSASEAALDEGEL